MRDDEMVFGVHRRLDVVANDSGAVRLRGSRIRVGQGNLFVRCFIELCLYLLEFLHLRLQGVDLGLRHGVFLALRRIQLVDKDVNNAYWIVFGNIVIQMVRQQDVLGSVTASYESASFINSSLKCHIVTHQPSHRLYK
jgi:hypothetical protein